MIIFLLTWIQKPEPKPVKEIGESDEEWLLSVVEKLTVISQV